MIVCSCNVLSDHQIRDVVAERGTRLTSQVYGCLGCSAQCGRCARTIRKIMDQALLSCGNQCACCPAHEAHTHPQGEEGHDHGPHHHGHHHHDHGHDHHHDHPHAHPHAPVEAAHEHDHPVRRAEPASHGTADRLPAARSGHAQLVHPHPVHGAAD
ncbi:bacterioferritin-associated ferredoxin [Rhodoplanes sp. SY1]|uniref:(2Fe-2S)-binding protein n=1 Tax=Rhodoplanes sp. SY1 TaxID=3166646 RepID=UPI0038B60415